jgi:hypothetical protein
VDHEHLANRKTEYSRWHLPIGAAAICLAVGVAGFALTLSDGSIASTDSAALGSTIVLSPQVTRTSVAGSVPEYAREIPTAFPFSGTEDRSPATATAELAPETQVAVSLRTSSTPDTTTPARAAGAAAINTLPPPPPSSTPATQPPTPASTPTHVPTATPTTPIENPPAPDLHPTQAPTGIDIPPAVAPQAAPGKVTPETPSKPIFNAGEIPVGAPEVQSVGHLAPGAATR